ncbi:L,D-transpeptidase [Actinotalea sp. JY-7876]|uniref:L,D-transpeptidase n=1 Tax=Actinotalea sp. JY-7876 TaxID=2758442 RepID=UPI0015F6C4E2|nr:L,D-transpeptidase [Actinotalea sp. JY-7876]
MPTPTPTGPPPAVVATSLGAELALYAEPDAAAPSRTLVSADVVSVPEVPLTALVVTTDGDWLEVLVPAAPAQGGTPAATAWVRADAVTLSSTTLRVEVRLAEHRLLVEDAGEVVLDVAVALGGGGVPAPGRYSVTELLQPPAGGALLGAYAYGLSGHRPVLAAFAAGEVPVAIHGGAPPEALGGDAPTGGVRLQDPDVARLVQEVGLPLGTPVDVVA